MNSDKQGALNELRVLLAMTQNIPCVWATAIPSTGIRPRFYGVAYYRLCLVNIDQPCFLCDVRARPSSRRLREAKRLAARIANEEHRLLVSSVGFVSTSAAARLVPAVKAFLSNKESIS